MTMIPMVYCKSALSRSNLPGLRYTFNPYIGCKHGCLYCYVADVLRKRTMSLNWGQMVQAKENIIELLKKDVQKNLHGIVGISTVTDPYQPAEKTLELTRQALFIFHEWRFPVSIQTKSDLVVRDLDIMKSDLFDVGITISCLDDEFCKIFEPGAPLPQRRIQALEEISSRGINTW
ncbi:MAG: radical SAM protein, partial [Candidatus Bathyarchaeota archaeon]